MKYYLFMMKFLKFVLIFLFMLALPVYAENLGIKDIAFDKSDNLIFMATDNYTTVPTVKKGVLTNPDRVYWDIENAVLKRGQATYNFENGKLSKFKISQFSTSPAKVRIVLTFAQKPDASAVKMISPGGGSLIIELGKPVSKQNFLVPIYRETKISSYDYLEKVRVYEEIPLPKTTFKDDVLSDIGKIYGQSVPQDEPVRLRPPIKESKLISRYFAQNIAVKSGNVLLIGSGVINIEKPIYLTNPSRVAFDIPNAVVAQNIKNKTLKISETETVKIAQFEPTKARIVVTSPTPEKWNPVYSGDLQNILLAHDERVNNVKLYNSNASVLSFKTEYASEYSANVRRYSFKFSNPVVISVKRNASTFDVTMHNGVSGNIAGLNSQGSATGAKFVQTGAGIRFSVPLTAGTTVECLETLNAKEIVVNVKIPKATQPKSETPKEQPLHPNVTPVQKETKKPTITIKKSDKILAGKVIVLDPGHGGSDPGAISQSKVQEKSLTISIGLLLEKLLKDNGATVYMTRSDDTYVSLSDRTTFSNAKSPDIFVSLHINAAENSSIHGIETHYWKDDSLELAKSIQKSMISKTGATNRGVIKSRFYVVRNTVAPSVLIEFGFITNPSELQRMSAKATKEKSVEAAFEGIVNYLKGAEK